MRQSDNGLIWDKVFKNGSSKIYGKQPLKKFKPVGSVPYYFKSFKGCLPQILLGPFLKSFSHLGTYPKLSQMSMMEFIFAKYSR